MKITVKNIETEYPKIGIELPEPLAKDKFEKLKTTFLPNYDKSDTIRKMVDTFIDKLNQVIAKSEPQKIANKAKKVADKANKSTQKANKSTKSATKPNKSVTKKPKIEKADQKCNSKTSTVKVEALPEDIRLIKRFQACVGNERQRRSILAIYRDMERRITERKVNKASKHADLIQEITNRLKRLLDFMSEKQLTHIIIEPSEKSQAFFEKVLLATKEVEIRATVNLLKRFIGVEGEVSPDKEKIQRLNDSFESAIKRGKVCEGDLYFAEFREAKKAIESFLKGESKKIAISPTGLNGIEKICGLGKPKATAKKTKKSASKSSGQKKAIKDKRTPFIVNAEFNTDLDLYINNKHKGTEFYLGYPSKILKQHGLEYLPIKLSKGTLKLKIKKHKFDAELLRDLPKKLMNPAFIFDSKRKDEKEFGISKLIVIGGRVQNEGVLSVIISKTTHKEYVINKVESIGGRDAKQIWYNIEGNNLLYHNKAKVSTILPDSLIVSDSNSQDFIAKVQQHLGIAKSNLSGIEEPQPETYEVTRFQVDISQPAPEPAPIIQDKPASNSALNGLFTPIAAQTTSNREKIELPGDLGKFLGYVERYEYSILLRGEKGAGKTRMMYQMMNTFAKGGFSVGCFSLEIGKDSNIVKDMRDTYISPIVANQIQIAESAPNGIEDIRAAAKMFDVIAIDSWSKIPGVKSEDFDKLRKEFPATMFIIIFQSTTNGTARGGSGPEYDAGIVIQVANGGRAKCEKNRYNGEDLTYLVFQRKLEESALENV